MKINDLLPPAFAMLQDKDFQVIHLAGEDKVNETKAKYANIKKNCLVLGSSDRMSMLYSASDLVISRSGGSTIAELALFGKFAILIPYPYASDNHQRENADYYASSGAGIILTETDFTITKIASLIGSFLDNPEEYIEKGKRALEMARPDAACKIIDLMRSTL